jgi:hypothetical protein
MAMHEAAALVAATSQVAGRLQRRAGSYVPGQGLAEPYPVPMLWNYLSAGSFEEAVQQWAQDAQRWDQEHMTRMMRELARIGQEKTSDWVDA